MWLIKRKRLGPRLVATAVFIAGVWSGFPGLISSVQAQQPSPPPEVLAYADMVLYNGQILTVDDSFTIGKAVAIRDEKFLAVGTNERIHAMAGPRTRRIDLQGKTVVPGFIDTHFHIHNFAQRGLRPSFAFRSRDQWLSLVKKLVDAAEPGEWVIISTRRTVDQPWAQSVFAMTRRDLDPISPNNPIFVHISPGGNDALVNGYALRLANMSSDYPGLIKDPESGEPNGMVEHAAYGRMYYEVIPYLPVEDLVPLYKAAMKKFVTAGKTLTLSRFPANAISVWKEIWAQGELSMRIRIAHEFARNARDPEALIKRVGNLSGFGDAWLKISAGNVGNPDGSLSAGRGWTRKPKLPEIGHATDPSAPDFGFVPYYQDRENSDWRTIPIFNRYGWRILGIHTAGDRSIDELFSAFEVAHQEKSLVGSRYAFDHTIMVRPEHIQTAKRLGLIASAGSKYIAASSEVLSRLYGADEVYQMSPIKSLLEAGVRVVMEPNHTDYYSSLWHIENFVTRKDENGKVWNESERITRQQALYMATNWGAYYSGDEKILGTIEPGKLADFVVLGGDFMKVPDDEISELGVLMTVVGGKVVYEAEGSL